MMTHRRLSSRSVLVLVADGVAAVRAPPLHWTGVRFLAPLALLVAAGVVAFLLLRGEGEDPAALAIDRYVAAWTRGDDAAAAALTDNPKAAAAALKANRAGLDGASVRARVLEPHGEERRARAGHVEGAGLRAVRLRRPADRGRGRATDWRVRWRETAVHPELDRDTRLGTSLDRPRRGEILDRDGRALVDRALRRRRRRRGRQGARRATAERIAALVDVDADELAAAHRGRAEGPLPARDHAARGRVRQGRGRADRGPGRLAEPHEGLARPVARRSRGRCSAPSGR